ncbi:MAG: NADH-quinone oxidoreductase subunit NuoE [candidate division WOR-3 bacterium]
MEILDKLIKEYKEAKVDIIQVLHHIQNEYNYLPKEVLIKLSRELHIPLSKIYSIATFYAAFSLTPRGKHLCTVCMGTACHVRGAPAVLSRIEERLGIRPGETTPDNNFTLETVNCLGACALAPIVVIDGEYHGQTTVNKIDRLLEKYAQKADKI